MSQRRKQRSEGELEPKKMLSFIEYDRSTSDMENQVSPVQRSPSERMDGCVRAEE